MGPKLLKHIIGELDSELKGGIISKIHQPDERDIIIRVFVRGREERLIISAHHKYPRVHLTEEVYPNPPSPLRFCAFLRSRITNARIESVTQVDMERIVRIELKKGYDGASEDFTLIAELTGKSSNIILIDKKGEILDAIRYFEADTIRPVMPGLPLMPLPPSRHEEGEEPLKEEGITWNRFADKSYSGLLKEEALTAGKSRLRRAINEAEKKVKRKLTNLNNDRTRAETELDNQRLGDILVSNLKKIKRGMKEAEADDYTKYPPEKVKIKLDEKLGPKENAEKYFKRSKKAKVALSLLKDRIPQTEGELDYINDLKYEWEAAKAENEIKALEDELVEGGYLKKMEEKALPERAERVEPIRRFTSSEGGFEILCGKSGPGNDLIVKKYAKDEDIWFHAHNCPGSHVVIKVAGRPKGVTKKVIEEAAALAAWHSKAQNAGKVEVVYTEARNVKKPKGAKPGMVTIKDYKSIAVKPKSMDKENN